MEKLKELLQTLFKLSGSQAMPSGDKVVLMSQNGPISQEVVAPNDGYLNFDARGSKANVTYLQSHALIYSDSSLRHGLMVPVKKSERVILYSGCDGLATLTFLRTVGGGLNSILESGGALCLRLKNTLARSLNSVAGKQCRQTRLFKWESQKMESHLTTLRQVMATSVCGSLMRQMQLLLKSRPQRIESCLSFQPPDLLGQLVYPLKKVKLYQLSRDMKRVEGVPVSLFPLSAQANFAIQGGAL